MKLSEIHDITDKKVKDKTQPSCDKQNLPALEHTKQAEPYKACTSSLQKNTELPHARKTKITKIRTEALSRISGYMGAFVEFVLNYREEFRAGDLITIPSDKLRFTNIAIEPGLYLRKEYFRIYAGVKSAIAEGGTDEERRVLVLGSPGVGKSGFGIFCLMLLIRERRNFTYTPIYEKPIYITFKDRDISISPWGEYAEYIGVYDEQESELIFGHKYVKVLLASPYDKNFNHFEKTDCYRYFMEPWLLDECADFAAKGLVRPDAEWCEKFKIVGGVARYLFDKSAAAEDLRSKVDYMLPESKDELITYFEEIINFSDQGRNRNMLFHYYQDGHYVPDVVFASMYVLVQVANKTKVNPTELLSILSLSGSFDLQVVQSKFFE